MASLDANIAEYYRSKDRYKLIFKPNSTENLIEGKEFDFLSNLAIDASLQNQKKGYYAA